MPFFYVPGNHDLTNKTMVTKWGERYGKRYYHFTYKNCLFLSLCSENPPDGMSTIDAEQQEWVAKTVEANKDVRWTFVFLHKPIWTAKDLRTPDGLCRGKDESPADVLISLHRLRRPIPAVPCRWYPFHRAGSRSRGSGTECSCRGSGNSVCRNRSAQVATCDLLVRS